MTPARVTFRFGVETHAFSLPAMLALAFLVGIIGGVYGIGGGAMIAPFCVAWFGLPIHAVAGAALAATFLTSVAGVVFYSLLPAPAGLATHPDWLLGLLFGAGGMFGYLLRRAPATLRAAGGVEVTARRYDCITGGAVPGSLHDGAPVMKVSPYVYLRSLGRFSIIVDNAKDSIALMNTLATRKRNGARLT